MDGPLGDGDPQQIVTQKNAAPIIHPKPPKHCKNIPR